MDKCPAFRKIKKKARKNLTCRHNWTKRLIQMAHLQQSQKLGRSSHSHVLIGFYWGCEPNQHREKHKKHYAGSPAFVGKKLNKMIFL